MGGLEIEVEGKKSDLQDSVDDFEDESLLGGARKRKGESKKEKGGRSSDFFFFFFFSGIVDQTVKYLESNYSNFGLGIVYITLLLVATLTNDQVLFSFCSSLPPGKHL